MLELYFFNVGHGDSIAIKFPNNSWGIVDCNRNSREEKPNVLKFLLKNSVQKLAFVCITHPHLDHFKGIDKIFDVYQGNIEKIILYGAPLGTNCENDEKSSLIKSLEIFCKSYNGKPKDHVILAKRGEVIQIEDASICFLNPTEKILNDLRFKLLIKNFKETKKDVNEASVIMKISCYDKEILLTGDSTKDNWEGLLTAQTSYNSNIIKISHHGSATSNSEKILDNITNKNQSISVISTDGGQLRKSIPSKDVIKYLKDNCKSEVLLTSTLNNSKIEDSSIPDLGQDDILNAVIEAVAQDSNETVIYDGFIKVTIDPVGNINNELYNSIEDFFS